MKDEVEMKAKQKMETSSELIHVRLKSLKRGGASSVVDIICMQIQRHRATELLQDITPKCQ